MKRTRIKKLAIILAALVTAYTLFGFFGLPPLLRWLGEKKLTELLHRPVRIEDIDLNPFSLTATVKGFAVKHREGEGDLAAFDSLFADLQGISLFKLGIVVSEFRLTQPRLNISRQGPGSYNFSDLIPAPREEAPTPGESAGDGLNFSVNNIQIVDGRLDFRDEPLGKAHSVRGLTLTLPFISNFDPHVDIFVEPKLTAEVNGKPVALRGKSKPFSARRETDFDLELSDVDVPYYLAYVPVELPFKVPTAVLDVKANLNFAAGDGSAPSLVLSGEAALKSVSVTDLAEAPLLKWQRLEVVLAPSGLLAGDIRVSRVALQQPEVTIERDATGVLNLQKMLPAIAPAEAATTPPAAASKQPQLHVDAVVIEDAKALFTDLSRAPAFESALFPIRLEVRDFSNRPNQAATLHATLNSEAGETVTLTGRFSVNPLKAAGTVSLVRALLSKYAPYYDDFIKFTVENGTLDFQTGFEADLGQEPPRITLADLSTRLENLKLKRIGETDGFVDIPELSVTGTGVDLNRRSVSVGEVTSTGGRLAIRRLKLGDLNVQDLFQPPPPRPAAPETAAVENREEPPWEITLNRLFIDRYTVDGEDRTFAEPVRMVIDQARLEASDFSTVPESRADLRFSGRLNQKGVLQAEGKVGIDPLAGELALKIAGHEPLWFQKYFEDRVQVIATGGKIDAGGTLSFAMEAETGLTLDYRGGLKVSDFRSVEKAGAEEFVRFKELAIDGAAVRVNPTSVAIEKIELDDFFTRLVLTGEGRLNVQDTVKTGGKEVQPTQGVHEGAPVPVSIDTVALKAGKIRFLDRFVAPGYDTTLGSIEGTLKGLSTDRSKAADIRLNARLEEQAPLVISGEVNPLAEELYADVDIRFDAMDLSGLSPYSGKFAGYRIQKGKLFLDLSYRIENKALQAKNKVLLDQFEFGKRVESPQATDLPVTLAVSLLKDRSGKISLDLPVSGRLDDPQFSLFGVIGQMIVNLLVKAATAPFALVGAMLGGGEELSHIEFDYGKARLDETAAAKLDQLITVLYDRPGLKLDISGYADSEKDREALAQIRFENKLKAQKLKALTAQGQAVGSLETMEILPGEYETYLAAALAEAGIPVPEALSGTGATGEPSGEEDEPAPKADAAEMERLLRESIRVEESDLKNLARDRAQAVRDYLQQSQKVEADRVFLEDPGTLTPPAGEGLKESRVELALK